MDGLLIYDQKDEVTDIKPLSNKQNKLLTTLPTDAKLVTTFIKTEKKKFYKLLINFLI